MDRYRTAYYALASERLGEDVGTWILRRRGTGDTPAVTWRDIAMELHRVAGPPVKPTDVTVSQWAKWAGATAQDALT